MPWRASCTRAWCVLPTQAAYAGAGLGCPSLHAWQKAASSALPLTAPRSHTRPGWRAAGPASMSNRPQLAVRALQVQRVEVCDAAWLSCVALQLLTCSLTAAREHRHTLKQ